MRLLSNFIAGIIFGVGLVLSGMTNPLKVQNFLDLFGTWDPSLAFVMGGAIMVTLPGYFLLKKRSAPLFAAKFEFPTRRDIDTQLIAGAAIFGIGWGIGGLCPGPALTSLTYDPSSTLLFVGAMLIGMVAAKMLKAKTTPTIDQPASS